MKKQLIPFSILTAAALLFFCGANNSDSGTAGRTGGTGISPAVFKLVKNAVFEVVLEKPEEKGIVYEKELDWEKVPYAIRSDKYYSIGTAFAISPTELITAFHVINLGYESVTYDKYYIRDSSKNIYEVDRITAGSNEKDFLIFTVKAKTFSEYFEFDRDYQTSDAVFSIGNALGEGIVVRGGLILGTVPEEDSGRWNLLKSSADGNPGNSGGPLVNAEGKVTALVTALRDNILYSVPAELLMDDSRESLAYRIKPRFGHLLLANKLNHKFETRPPLPDTYTSVRRKIREAYEKDYDTAMSTLFKEAPEYLLGPNNAYLLNSAPSTIFPELGFVDPNDDNWKLSGLERKNYPLDDDGRLMHAAVSKYHFYKIKKPRPVPLEKINTSPRYIMDIILQNIRSERTLWGSDKYRILSYGEPFATGEYTDTVGRNWITACWNISYNDKVLIMYILPLPNGPALITTTQDSALQTYYEWDMKKICDHAFITYAATFAEWTEFISLKKYMPAFFSGLWFQWQSDEQRFSFECGPLSISAGKDVFEWADDSELFLVPSWFKQNDKVELGIRKVILNRDIRGKEFIVLYRNVKPDPKLGSSVMGGWNDLAAEKYPFNGSPVISAKDNTGSVGAIIKAVPQNPNVIHSLYLSMENPQNEENLNRRFSALKPGITIKE